MTRIFALSPARPLLTVILYLFPLRPLEHSRTCYLMCGIYERLLTQRDDVVVFFFQFRIIYIYFPYRIPKEIIIFLQQYDSKRSCQSVKWNIFFVNIERSPLLLMLLYSFYRSLDVPCNIICILCCSRVFGWRLGPISTSQGSL